MAQVLQNMLNGVIGKGQSVITGIPDPFIMVDSERNVVYMNEPCAELTGFTDEEVVGKLKGTQVFNPNDLP
jgi:PAS domain S-box-containing protein